MDDVNERAKANREVHEALTLYEEYNQGMLGVGERVYLRELVIECQRVSPENTHTITYGLSR